MSPLLDLPTELRWQILREAITPFRLDWRLPERDPDGVLRGLLSSMPFERDPGCINHPETQTLNNLHSVCSTLRNDLKAIVPWAEIVEDFGEITVRCPEVLARLPRLESGAVNLHLPCLGLSKQLTINQIKRLNIGVYYVHNNLQDDFRIMFGRGPYYYMSQSPQVQNMVNRAPANLQDQSLERIFLQHRADMKRSNMAYLNTLNQNWGMSFRHLPKSLEYLTFDMYAPLHLTNTLYAKGYRMKPHETVINLILAFRQLTWSLVTLPNFKELRVTNIPYASLPFFTQIDMQDELTLAGTWPMCPEEHCHPPMIPRKFKIDIEFTKPHPPVGQTPPATWTTDAIIHYVVLSSDYNYP